jgi:hypothetical protein
MCRLLLLLVLLAGTADKPALQLRVCLAVALLESMTVWTGVY